MPNSSRRVPSGTRAPLVIIIALAALAAGLATARSAQASTSQPAAIAAAAGAAARAAVRADDPAVWYTCKPRAIRYLGAYRIDNDLFAGMRGKSCISSTGTSLTIRNNVKEQGPVVRYPAIRVGPYFDSRDPDFGPPVRVGRLDLVLHVRATGHSGGLWITDNDTWFYPRPNVSRHGNNELVIGIRYTGWAPGPQWRKMDIGHRWWWANHHITCNPTRPTRCWPLTVLRAVHQVSSATISLPDFIYHLLLLHWLSSSEWFGSTAFGTECWSGCRGLTDGMTAVVQGVALKA